MQTLPNCAIEAGKRSYLCRRFDYERGFNRGSSSGNRRLGAYERRSRAAWRGREAGVKFAGIMLASPSAAIIDDYCLAAAVVLAR